jgi:hypothetical protein
VADFQIRIPAVAEAVRATRTTRIPGDEGGLPRVLQVHELLEHLTDGKMPTESLVPFIKEVRKLELTGSWY